MSWLELLEFVEALPEDSATKAALKGHGTRRWTEADFMQAWLLNLLMLLIKVQWAAGQMDGPPPKLDPCLVPGQEPTAEDVSQRAEQLAQIAALRPAPLAAPQVDLRELEAVLRARQAQQDT